MKTWCELSEDLGSRVHSDGAVPEFCICFVIPGVLHSRSKKSIKHNISSWAMAINLLSMLKRASIGHF